MGQQTLISNVKIVQPQSVIPNGWILIKDEHIVQIGDGSTPEIPDAMQIDGKRQLALPGFIDVHVHGAMGYECMDASHESIHVMAQFYAQHGVTSFLATTWTAPQDKIMKALQNIVECEGTQSNGATLLGAHLEGPFLNPDRCGAQDSRQIRRAHREEVLPYLDLGIIRELSLAPEYPENHWLISECAKRGITVSAAHTAATYVEMHHAISLGLSQTTHTFNAMTGLNHREPGTVGAALDYAEIACELIADNVHVHPAVIRLLMKCKGPDKVILITDSVRAAGLAEGTNYTQDNREISILSDRVILSDGTLAGSILTMDQAFRNLCLATQLSPEDCWQTSSLSAAQAIGLADKTGTLEQGKFADLVLLDSALEVSMTIARGQVVFSGT
jgi:N-acetylglucosamine-6-phosphate deacetylase